MFDYAQRMQLALTDVARRSAMKIVAGVVMLIGAGFLLAALWSWLAYGLGWGPTMASLVIGAAAVVIGVIVLVVSNQRRHEMPTTQDLKHEVEAQLNLVADAAVDRVKGEARRVVGMAESKAQSLMDEAGYRAQKLASDTEERVYGFARGVGGAVGLNADNLHAATDTARRAAGSNAGSMAKLIGAFAMGITLASKLQEARHGSRHDFDPDDII
jgi:hypothetical protein